MIIGIETDRGLLVTALLAAGYLVHAVNPLAASRYRERHTVSRAKSDRGDARMLADLVRSDRQHHRQVASDSELHGAIKVLARSHQNLIWTRQRQTNALRSALREYYPGALVAFPELSHPDALAVLAMAPDPERGRRLGEARIISALRRAGRQRNLERRAREDPCRVAGTTTHRSPAGGRGPGGQHQRAGGGHHHAGRTDRPAGGRAHRRLRSTPGRRRSPRSLPGLGDILGARVLAEFGDAPDRYADATARRNYAGTAPITRASGTSRVVVARLARNKRLFDACYQWAFCALTRSPGARVYYDDHDPGPHTSKVARRKLANKLVGILHGCLVHRTMYDVNRAWHQASAQLAA